MTSKMTPTDLHPGSKDKQMGKQGADYQKMLMATSVDMAANTYHRAAIDLRSSGDYGADPIGDGTYRMVPSGDVVDYAERCKRLTRR